MGVGEHWSGLRGMTLLQDPPAMVLYLEDVAAVTSYD